MVDFVYALIGAEVQKVFGGPIHAILLDRTVLVMLMRRRRKIGTRGISQTGRYGSAKQAVARVTTATGIPFENLYTGPASNADIGIDAGKTKLVPQSLAQTVYMMMQGPYGA